MYRTKIFVTAFLLFWLHHHVLGQGRISYVELLRSERQSQIYFEHTLHPSSDSLTDFNVFFRIENDFLSFTKNRDNTFRAEIKGSVEVFDSTGMVIRTAFWSSQKQVNSYEKTQVRDEFLAGRIHTELPKGNYSYQLKFQGSGQRREISSERIRVSIFPRKADWFYMIKEQQSALKPDSVPDFINYGGNTVYGKDFTTAFTFSGNAKNALSYRLEQLEITEKDTLTVATTLDKKTVEPTWILSGKAIRMKSGDIPEPELFDYSSFSTVLIPVANKTYPNAHYRISIFDGDSLLGKKIYQSFWYDMPLSLLNLDVSIDMLRFILPADKIKTNFSGNEAKKSEAFITFWKQKDPTPDSDFNELMNEYYKRIDFAFKEYSTPTKPGFDTDMGKIYIVYGPPLRKDRALPSNGFVVETWMYSGRSFSFQANSGFGDFQLIK